MPDRPGVPRLQSAPGDGEVNEARPGDGRESPQQYREGLPRFQHSNTLHLICVPF